MKRRRPLREQLAVAKAQLRAVHAVLRSLPSRNPDDFICGWGVSGRAVSQCLDGHGQVWESVTELDKTNGKPKTAGWIKVGMERR